MNHTNSTNSIELMIEEHKLIMRMLKVVRRACFAILKGEKIVFSDFDKIIDFIKNYADVHHHGKEEKFLFQEMQTHLGNIGTNLITHGMLVEHDYGRLYISQLVEALDRVKQGDEESKLDIISNAVGYTHLLTRHIGKEDAVVYQYGAGNLPAEILDQINQKTTDFEAEAMKKGTQKYYQELVESLEHKYNV